jgi:hypothetical protein
VPFRFAEAARVLPTADAADTPHSIDAKDDPYDYNRNKLVNATDQIIVRNNSTRPFTALKLITPPREDDGRSDGEGEWGGDLWTTWTDDSLPRPTCCTKIAGRATDRGQGVVVLCRVGHCDEAHSIGGEDEPFDAE